MNRDDSAIEPLNLDQLREQWPDSEDGRLAARLAKRFLLTKLIESAAGAECTADRSQAESGGSKAIAIISKDFGSLLSDAPKREPRKPIAPLHRFQAEKPKEPENNDF